MFAGKINQEPTIKPQQPPVRMGSPADAISLPAVPVLQIKLNDGDETVEREFETGQNNSTIQRFIVATKLHEKIPKWPEAYAVISKVFEEKRKDFWDIFKGSGENHLIFKGEEKMKDDATTMVDGSSIVIELNIQKYKNANNETLGKLIATLIHELEIHAVPDAQQITLLKKATTPVETNNAKKIIKDQNKQGGRFHVNTQHHNLAINAKQLDEIVSHTSASLPEILEPDEFTRLGRREEFGEISAALLKEVKDDISNHKKYLPGKYGDISQITFANILNLPAEEPVQKKQKQVLAGKTTVAALPAVPVLQKKSKDSEETLQRKLNTAQFTNNYKHASTAATPDVIQREVNKTGLPDELKSGVENLSGFAMDDVRVHYNSSKPAQIQAHAYAQGTDIHIAPGQEKHLPHEAWHVVQQKQGRVKPTLQMKGVAINDDGGLEKEADLMGNIAKHSQLVKSSAACLAPPVGRHIVQKVDWEWWGEALKNTARGAIARPGAALGALAGGLMGQGAGAMGAIGGMAAGAAATYYQTGDVITAIGGGVAGAAIGYSVPVAGAAAGGALIGDALNNVVSPLLPKTKITHTAGHITLVGLNGQQTHHAVGKKMEAKLAADDPVAGSATGINWTWMQHLRNKYRAANIVRGHLLNHDLGGFGAPENLYPISTKANQDHSINVEQKVKKLLLAEIINKQSGEAPKLVNYDVEVIENQAQNPVDATFNCTFYTDGKTPATIQVHSALGKDKGGFGGEKENPLEKTSWHHGDRSGFEGVNEKKSLTNYRKDKKINVIKEPFNGLTPNVDAPYTAGEGLRAENEGNIFDNLVRDYLKDWPTDLKESILMNLGIKEPNAGNYRNEVLKFVRNTASYADNKNEAFSFAELIVQVLQEQLEELYKKFQYHKNFKHVNDILSEAYQSVQTAIAANYGFR